MAGIENNEAATESVDDSGSRESPDQEQQARQQQFAPITFSYLKQHYYDPDALRRRTMDEFVRAMRTGRMIAFTGSMTTEDRGYTDWNTFVNECFESANRHFDKHNSEAKIQVNKLKKFVKLFKDRGDRLDFRLDKRVSFSIIGDTVDVAAQYSGKLHVNPNQEISEKLFLRRSNWNSDETILGVLLDELGIDRTITLNYDLEIELAYSQRGKPNADSEKALDELGFFDKDRITGRITKQLPGARSMVSDIFNRERADRLIEFAVGSADHEYHVLHLHGRADAFDSMVVSYRDYDRLYRRSGLSKAPFEHALKLLFAGNPILFVGIGMSEAEVNRTLQDFVGNQPYRRVTPTFLLWNSFLNDKGVVDEDACDIFRIDMLHRLGILTIFSHQLDQSAEADLGVVPDKGTPARHKFELERLRGAIGNLANELVRNQDSRKAPLQPAAWRSMLKRAETTKGLIATWEVSGELPPSDTSEFNLNELAGRLTVATGDLGTGKGTAARQLADAWIEANPDGVVALLNADFCLDTDSLLNLVADVLRVRKKPGSIPSKISRNHLFQMEGAFTLGKPLLIVFYGVERLFGTNGEPLSAEFDDMLRAYLGSTAGGRDRKKSGGGTASPKVSADVGMVLFTTSRSQAYFNGLIGSDSISEVRLKSRIGNDPVQSNYIGHIDKSGDIPFNKVPGLVFADKSRPSREISASGYRRAFFAAYLNPDYLEKAGIKGKRGRLALDVLTVMAHVGQPVESDVLFLAPRIQRRLKQLTSEDIKNPRGAFGEVIDNLECMKLIIPLKAFQESEPFMNRYGLHPTLLSEIRERSGVPLSEAVLSAAFNMSLYTAQPTDGPLPETFLHDELGQLIDWMIGAWKDVPLSKALGNANNRCRPDAIAALRAALATIRGYYSTTTLLALDGKDRAIGFDRDGALSEHAERLGRLLSAFRNSVDELVEIQGKRPAGPFYADEIVWLYNEIGVVRLAQGDLYEARFAFDEAERYNHEYVEFDDRSHNWRRIMLNQIVVDIERARLDSAERRIKQIERQIGNDKIELVAKITSEKGPIPIPTQRGISHEEILAVGLIAGYRGICSHIFGETVDAQEHYDAALEILRRLDERRAYATFLRHRAGLRRGLMSTEDIRLALDLAVSAAESVRQMDLVHHSRIQRANRAFDARDIDAWTRATRQLHEALVYADDTDMYRVRVEARANLAVASMTSGDYEVALEHATEALTLATRYGLSLRKISLRILIGRILMRRGDPQSGRALIESGKAAANRVGYQQAISSAQTALTLQTD